MNLKQFKYVLVLSGEGSFSKAADVLNISQPSLSQYIRKIEKKIGLKLFERTGSNVRLTDAGRVYIDAGKKILDIQKQMENRLLDLAEDKTGSIIVGISPHRSVHLMPRVVREFHRLYPGMKLVLDERSGHELRDAAFRGEFDVCIIPLPVDTKTYEYHMMMKEEIVLAVPSGSEFDKLLKSCCVNLENRTFPAVDINLINGHDFITLGEYMPMKVITDNLCKQYDLNLNYVVEVRSNEALVSMVSSGTGSSLISSCLANFRSEEGMVEFYSFVQDIPFRDIAVIYRKEKYLSRPTRDLIKILTGGFSDTKDDKVM
ncbi:MAG: LysR family transcriptional regulator [Lachnospiraceae bacterium]|jgi:DNA-binding transcriptional LysR family regulator